MKTAILVVALAIQVYAFGGIIPKVQKEYDRIATDYPDCQVVWKIIPYDSFPFFCAEEVNEADSGRVLTYKKSGGKEIIKLEGFILPNEEVRIVAISWIKRKKIKSKVYRMFFFKKNSKGNWYHTRPVLKIPMVLLPDGAFSCQK